jgi:hypothetical protein
MKTTIALRTHAVPRREEEYSAVISLTPEEADRILEYIELMKHVSGRWPEAWQVSVFAERNPVYVPVTDLPGALTEDYQVLPRPPTVRRALRVDEGQMRVRGDAVAWAAVDPSGNRLIETRELSEQVIRAVSSGLWLKPGVGKLALAAELGRVWFCDPHPKRGTLH